MFPNDDICNVEVAKMAAMRLFKKYKRRGNTQESGLGKKEVNRLMRATYDAINMRTNDSKKPMTPTKKMCSNSWASLIPTTMVTSNSKTSSQLLSNTSAEFSLYRNQPVSKPYPIILFKNRSHHPTHNQPANTPATRNSNLTKRIKLIMIINWL